MLNRTKRACLHVKGQPSLQASWLDSEVSRNVGKWSLTIPDLLVIRLLGLALGAHRGGRPHEVASGPDEPVQLQQQLAALAVPGHAAARAVDDVVHVGGVGLPHGAHHPDES